MKSRNIYWILIFFGLSIYFSPIVFRFYDHASDVRLAMTSGILVGSAALWTLGDDKIRLVPVLVIHTCGWILIGVSLALGVLGDDHILKNLLPYGGLLVLLTSMDAIRLMAEKKYKIP